MSRILARLFLILFCGLLALSAPVAATAAVDPNMAGFGESEEEPIGDLWDLPPGVTVAEAIRGFSVFDQETKCPTDPEAAKGAGTLVQLCLPLTYSPPRGISQSLPIKVHIEPGTIFIPDNINTQNGINIKKWIVEIRPGETVYIPVMLMCLNQSRSGSSPADVFRMGPITRHPGMKQLLAMLETKQVAATVGPESDGMHLAMLQQAVWQVTDREPLSASVLSAIAALPDE